MKRILFLIMIMAFAVAFAACSAQTEQNTGESPKPRVTQNAAEPSIEGTPEQEAENEEAAYEFEFTDIDGNVHKLADYAGKPVYLRVWASWCSVCISTLEDLNELAGEAKDYHVLSVVMPTINGEMDREDFTAWYKEFGYDNLTVMFDDLAQVVRDFGINAFPTQIMFDAEGRVVYGVVGSMSTDMINDTMQKIIDEA